MTKVLIAPGLGNSGLIHWQSIWEKEHPEYKRIEQLDWEKPVKDDWVKSIEEEVSQTGEDVVIVAHSLACIALAFWGNHTKHKIKAALLVAPPDTERADFPNVVSGFYPIPLNPLPFKTILIASTNDPYITLERCRFFAQALGSKFINIGAKGHINSASGLRSWEEGKLILKELL